MRGSRHAWDIRLISTDALAKLVELKEGTEGAETGLKIRSLLVPMEFTRLDRVIDVMFTAAKDVENVAVEEVNEDLNDRKDSEEHHDKFNQILPERASLQKKREQIILSFGRYIGEAFIKRSLALYWNADHSKRIACTISKRYESRGGAPYWFAYHPKWSEFLLDGIEGYLILGCMDLDVVFSVPVSIWNQITKFLNTTTRENGQIYQHIHIVENTKGLYSVLTPKRDGDFSLEDYKINL